MQPSHSVPKKFYLKQNRLNFLVGVGLILLGSSQMFVYFKRSIEFGFRFSDIVFLLFWSIHFICGFYQFLPFLRRMDKEYSDLVIDGEGILIREQKIIKVERNQILWSEIESIKDDMFETGLIWISTSGDGVSHNKIMLPTGRYKDHISLKEMIHSFVNYKSNKDLAADYLET